MLLLEPTVIMRQRMWNLNPAVPQVIRHIKYCSSDDNIIFEEINGKGVITLNRPQVMHTLSSSMVNKICKHMKDWRQEMKPVIFKATRSKAFCAGGNLKEVDLSRFELVKILHQMTASVATYPAPCIVLVDGVAMGAGCSLTAHAQFGVATERTVLAMPEVAFGCFPDQGASYFLPRLRGRLGYLMGLAGHRLEGREVLEAGIASHFCHSDHLQGLQQALLSCTGKSPADLKHMLDEHTKSSSPVMDRGVALNLEDVERCFSAATVEEIMLRLEQLDHSWARKALSTMLAASPVSLKVTKKLLDKGSTISLWDCLLMEYGLAVNFALYQAYNVEEGIQTMLIDMDRQPRWKPASLEEVKSDMIEKLFDSHPSRFPFCI